MDHRPTDFGWGRGDRPVIDVSWNDAQIYLRWLNRKAGFEGNDPRRYRLISEAEWEYAARAGTATRFYWGDDPEYKDVDVHAVNSGSETARVATKRPNSWNLYDMNGNVYEWVDDRWHENYHGAPVDGSAWVEGGSGVRVVRGGSWNFLPKYLRSAFRFNKSPGLRRNYLGFRIARTLE